MGPIPDTETGCTAEVNEDNVGVAVLRKARGYGEAPEEWSVAKPPKGERCLEGMNIPRLPSTPW